MFVFFVVFSHHRFCLLFFTHTHSDTHSSTTPQNDIHSHLNATEMKIWNINCLHTGCFWVQTARSEFHRRDHKNVLCKYENIFLKESLRSSCKWDHKSVNETKWKHSFLFRLTLDPLTWYNKFIYIARQIFSFCRK